jgi:hypothetical protein|tara:strand:+ start:34343 stop:35059 length:717 start_codon:yes stop_codon:yes gene_type:complete
MYALKNYLLSMQSHWMINQPLYQSVQESMPDIARFRALDGTEDLKKVPIMNHCKRVFPGIWRVPLFRREFCKMLMEEIEHMQKEIGFEENESEDTLRQIPEIVLAEHVPELNRAMWFVVQNILNPIFWCLYQRDCADISTVQIANYNLKDKSQGAWHHDESADISVVVPLNTNQYKGGGTEFHQWGKLKPLPSGHALIFPSFTNMHRGLPVEEGDRFLLVFWLHSRKRLAELGEQVLI